MRQHSRMLVWFAVALALYGCGYRKSGSYGYGSSIDDEALRYYARSAGRTPQQAAYDYLPQRIDNYFQGMDGIVQPPADFAYQLLDKAPGHTVPAVTLKDPVDNDWEVLGRNTWMIWGGGNEGFWDWLSTTYGFIDLLRIAEVPRETRFAYGGLINEPGMERRGPDPFGLNLDVPTDPEIAAWREQYIKRVFHLDSTCSGQPDSYKNAGSGSGSYGYQQSSASYPPPSGGYVPPAQGDHMTGYGAWPAPPGPDGKPSKKIPPPEIYGLSSGVIGLRLFPNPFFDADACKKWNAAKYRDDPNGNANLVRPYRVAMTCAFCHASWHPLNPPTQMEKPEWSNISGNIGAQYLRPRVAFGNLLTKDNFIYHLLDSQPPGTIDTSLIASDNINNPNTMNAVFNLPQRTAIAYRNVTEKQGPGSAPWPSVWRTPELTRDNNQPYDRAHDSPLKDAVPNWVADFFHGAGVEAEVKAGVPGMVNRRVSRILLDGADSIGAWGALARVYLNIGTNWEQWNTLHAPVIGFRDQKPFTIANTEHHSVYWMATELRVPALREYFLKVSPPMPLLATPHGADRVLPPPSSTDGATPPKNTIDRAEAKRLADAAAELRRHSVDVSKLARGRKMFADNCITCHSSIQSPERQAQLNTAAGGQFWDRDPAAWLTDPGYIAWAEKAVEDPAFWKANYLSTDMRIAINLVQTNSCRAMATNAMNDHMWEDFSSDSYRSMPSVGGIPFFNPYKAERTTNEQGFNDEYYPRHAVKGAPPSGGGPGFYRVPTLVSIWATAPFLHNNSLGLFNNDPSVNGRLDSFDDSIRKLLTPAKRLESSSYNDATPDRLKEDHGLIWRTTEDTYIVMPGSYLPKALGSWVPLVGWIVYRFDWVAQLPSWARPVPTLVILLIAILLFMRTNRLDVRRVVAYLLLVVAIGVGTFVYFLNGGFGGIRVGPIPKGVPINMMANVNPEAGTLNLLKLFFRTRDALTQIASQQPDRKHLDALLAAKVAPELLKVSKCPDLVMDHGHEYDWFKRMSDADKDALIELLKTF